MLEYKKTVAIAIAVAVAVAVAYAYAYASVDCINAVQVTSKRRVDFLYIQSEYFIIQNIPTEYIIPYGITLLLPR